MDNGLQEVISAAVNGTGHRPAKETPKRRVPQLSVVATERPAPPEAETEEPRLDETTPNTVPNGTTFPPTSHLLGHGSLRLAFWICGFHDALMERQRNGDQLTEKEELLLSLSPRDFADIRPLVIETTLGRLDAVVNAPDLPVEAADLAAIHPMEAFALATLRNLSQRARETLLQDGPDAALALFGESAEVLEPLAIFRLVFSTALDLVESFERVVPVDAMVLSRLAEALDAEVDRI
jgi:hypothetical protein